MVKWIWLIEVKKRESLLLHFGYSYSNHSGNYLRQIDLKIADIIACRHNYLEQNSNRKLDEHKQMCVELDDENQNTISGYAGGRRFAFKFPHFFAIS